eukprot:NODE_1813_length_885_cov_136.933014_g1264_i0.p2 GENE.NODE_1813_length_885_cov_136.933014_g1264_i0~~NODE_1813_length_885_cov_136.933014_g1264_i0.p2  ORF type:complete len:164 (+),score=48.32 NODE_1813_length_885_cov_136.933014_g1264_i0:23-493(+)
MGVQDWSEENPALTYGCALEIHSMQMAPDGRSYLDITGARRFKVLQWGLKDGYHVGRIEWVDDDEAEEARLNEDGSTDLLIQQVKGRIERIARHVMQMAVQQLGPKPADDSRLSFWLAALLGLQRTPVILDILSARTVRRRYEVLRDLLTTYSGPL